MSENRQDAQASEEVREQAPKAQPLKLDEQGALILENNEEMDRVIGLWMRSEMLPPQFTANDHWQKNERYRITPVMARYRIFTAWHMLNAFGFTFRQALPLLKYFAFVKGAVFIYGDLPLLIVERSGMLESKEEFYFDREHVRISFENRNTAAEVFGALCRVKPIGGEWAEEFYTVDDAVKAGFLPPGGPRNKFADNERQRKFEDSAWHAHTQRMLRFRARGFALRDNFARAFADRLKVNILESDAQVVPHEYADAEVLHQTFNKTQQLESKSLDLNEIY